MAEVEVPKVKSPMTNDEHCAASPLCTFFTRQSQTPKLCILAPLQNHKSLLPESALSQADMLSQEAVGNGLSGYSVRINYHGD